jgi:hypothetical protein
VLEIRLDIRRGVKEPVSGGFGENVDGGAASRRWGSGEQDNHVHRLPSRQLLIHDFNFTSR